MNNDEQIHVHFDDVLCAADNAGQTVPDIVIRHGEAARIYTYKGQQYSLGSVQALIDLIRVRGSQERTIIIYNDSQIRVILDDSVQDREQDTATYGFKFSDQFREWLLVLGRPLVQKVLVDFLKHRPDTELTLEYRDLLLGAAQNLKIVTETVGEFEYTDNNNIGVSFKTKDGEGHTYIPASFEVALPILNEGADFIIEIEIELKKPTTDDSKLYFTLTCPNKDRYVKDAADDEVRKLKKALEGYIILAGS